MKRLKIPEATIIRLSVYSRYFTELERQGIVTLSSNEIAKGVGVSPAQIRKDLAFFGDFGTKGVGYNLQELQQQVLKILSLDEEWNVALVGLGHLGLALSSYKGFRERGFDIRYIFDNDPSKIGTWVNDVEVLPQSRLIDVVKQNKVQIGIISVPSEFAQEAADSLVQGGVQAILNFAPVFINVPPDIKLRNVDLAGNMELISYNVS